MELSALVASFTAVLIAVLKKFNWLSPSYETLVSAVLGLAAQVLLTVLAGQNNPQLTQTVTLILNLLVGALSGIAGTQFGVVTTQVKAAARSLRN